MKLVLASQGFTTSEIADAVAELTAKPLDTLSIAFINEAYTEIEAAHDERWLVNEISQVAQYAKGMLSFVNLRAYDIQEIERRLEFADLIYIVGGAQIILPKLFQETGFDKLLTKLAERKVIMGTSAGANVLGRQIEDAAYWQDQYGSRDPYLAALPLGLVDFNILPHFGRADHPRRIATRLRPLLKENPFPLYGITDTQAVIYDHGTVRFVGGEPVTLGG